MLCQPFPTLALIGPRVLGETRTSFPAVEIELSPAELRWLNLEEEHLAGLEVSVSAAMKNPTAPLLETG